MNDYERLKLEFDKNVKKLQRDCIHRQKQLIESWWAPGHRAGHKLVVCKNCNKVLEKKL